MQAIRLEVSRLISLYHEVVLTKSRMLTNSQSMVW